MQHHLKVNPQQGVTDSKFPMPQRHRHCFSVQDKKHPSSWLQRIARLTEARDCLDKDPELGLFSFFHAILISAGASKDYYHSTSPKVESKTDIFKVKIQLGNHSICIIKSILTKSYNTSF